jgi:ABC-type transport system involved in multi-copper enzyme maturation permease subunit
MSEARIIPYTNEPIAGPGGFWTQTAALLVDAYRDLQSRKLFWLALILSTVVPLLFAAVGLDPQGLSIFGQHLRGVPFNSVLVPPGEFFKLMFTTLAIPFWLGCAATMLALIVVGGMFPDVIGSGSIDLYLSRPIGRLRLFFTKYVFGLLFTSLQVLCFAAVSFGVIGIRGGVWEPRIFLAVPLVTLYFSYFYCVCVLIGIVTRSTLAAILLTTILWGLIFVLDFSGYYLSDFAVAADVRVAQTQRLIDANDALIQRDSARPPEQQSNLSAIKAQRDYQRGLIVDDQEQAASLHWWKGLIRGIQAPLPKARETVAAMDKWLLTPGAFQPLEDQQRQRREQWQQRRGNTGPQRDLDRIRESDEARQRLDDELSARDLPWIVGTSLGFEAFILGLAAWVFCRKDF